MFKTKTNADGLIERYKAQLVAKGYHQCLSIDFVGTFSPVVKPTTVRLLLSMAVSQDWVVHELAISNAFLHGKLLGIMYMIQPHGFVNLTYLEDFCKLEKSIYRLKQAPHVWNQCLIDALHKFGFKGSKKKNSSLPLVFK